MRVLSAEGGLEESFFKASLNCKKREFVTKQQIQAVLDLYIFYVKLLNLIRKNQVLLNQIQLLFLRSDY